MDKTIKNTIRKIQMVPVEALKAYENNPRNNDVAVPSIVESIKRYGFNVPITCDKNGVIATGHTRYKAALQLGLKEVPVIYLDDLSEEEIAAWRLVDNKTSELATWNEDKLNVELLNLSNAGIDLSPFNFKLEDKPTTIVENETHEDNDFNYSEALKKKSRVSHGQVWKLGNHRLMCGDSLKVEDVKRLINGESVDLVFTDPPYGMGKEKDGIINDNQNQSELVEFNKKWISLSFDALKDNGSWYCWGNDISCLNIYAEILLPMIKAKKIVFRNLITWDKGSVQGQMSEFFRQYAPATEKCLFVMCGAQAVQGFQVNSYDYNPKMDKVRLYMVGEAERLGITPAKIKEITGTQMYGHWFTTSQFCIPTREQYFKLQNYYKSRDGFKKEYDELKKEYDELKKEFYEGRSYFNNTHDNMNDVWHFDRVAGDDKSEIANFATPKPIGLCARGIKSSSRPGEIVLDMFGGSGSTLMACEQLGRRCLMMELSAKYCELIITRWEHMTGKKAELIEN